MDGVEKREEGELFKDQKIQMLEQELGDKEKEFATLEKHLFEAQEKNLDLRFEKETFDLQFARLQKRIQDLEHFKMASAQFSAQLK